MMWRLETEISKTFLLQTTVSGTELRQVLFGWFLLSLRLMSVCLCQAVSNAAEWEVSLLFAQPQ